MYLARTNRILLTLLTASCLIGSVATAQTLYSSTEVNSEYGVYCQVYYEDGYGYYSELEQCSDSFCQFQGFRKWLRKFSNQIWRYRKSIRRANRQGNTELASALTAQRDALIADKAEVKSCRNGGYEPDGGGSGGGGSGGGGSGGGGSNLSSAACQAFESAQITSTSLSRIINGNKCSNASSTAVVEVYLDGGPGCTGTYVGDGSDGNSRVIFASHCIENVSSVEIVTGGGQRFSVSSFHGHPNWGQGSSTEVNDVAIAVVNGSMSGTIPAIPVCSGGVSSGMSGYIAGYGYINGSTQQADGLYAGTTVSLEVTSTSISALHPGVGNVAVGTATTCNGDSGGPLMLEVGGSKCIAGAVSWGTNQTCGTNGNSDHGYWANLTDPSNLVFISEHAPGLFGFL